MNEFLFLLSNTICTSTISSEYFVLVIEIFYSVRSFSTLVIGGGTHVSVFLPLPPTDALLSPAIFSLSRSLCSASASSSSATVFPSHVAPAPATSQVTVFFSHTTTAPACRTRWFSPNSLPAPQLTWALPAAGPRTAGGARGPRHRVHLLKYLASDRQVR